MRGLQTIWRLNILWNQIILAYITKSLHARCIKSIYKSGLKSKNKYCFEWFMKSITSKLLLRTTKNNYISGSVHSNFGIQSQGLHGSSDKILTKFMQILWHYSVHNNSFNSLILSQFNTKTDRDNFFQILEIPQQTGQDRVPVALWKNDLF